MVPEDIAHTLHNALKHLDDALSLAESPLIEELYVDSEDPASALHRMLVEAIEAFRPASPHQIDERDLRRYQILHGCFVERHTQDAVAEQLGISPRHLRREQKEALHALAQVLVMRSGRGLGGDSISSSVQGVAADELAIDVNREMQWLVQSSKEKTTDVVWVFEEAMRVANALASTRDVTIHLENVDSEPIIAAVPSTVTRQIVLLMINSVTRAAPSGSSAKVTVQTGREEVVIAVTGRLAESQQRDALDAEESVRSARQLLDLFSGHLTVSAVRDILVASASLPLAGKKTVVLAIEDNAHTLRMWRRFLQRTAFQLVSERDGLRATDTAARLTPDFILLDIMLGGTDGWDVLRRLRRDPKTVDTPVIVCSVLPQEELARSLGAIGFIRKPITGEAFRSALEMHTSAARRALAR